MMSDKIIVTHTNPDLDAITGVWLLKRFGGLSEAIVKFVNTGNPDPDSDLLENAIAVVDTGKEYATDELRFDHHQFPGQKANDTCATKMVFTNIVVSNPNKDFRYLQPLIDMIFAGDTGRSEANQSREIGLHAIFSGYKAWWSLQNPGMRMPNEVIYSYGYGLLDVLEIRLRKQAEARAELAEKTVYKSEDGKVWAILYGSVGSSFAAFDEGAQIVVFEGDSVEVEGGYTYPVGIMRGNELQEPNVGGLAVSASIENPRVASEVDKWFLHPAGFFAGRGTAKAPVFEPSKINLKDLARAIDKAWLRT
jgi:hypothetical protein